MHAIDLTDQAVQPPAVRAPAFQPSAQPLPPFDWPLPPGGLFRDAGANASATPCEVTSRDGRRTKALLVGVDRRARVLLLLQPPETRLYRTPLDRLRSVLLLRPLEPAPSSARAAVEVYKPTAYRIALDQGEDLVGETAGHVETELGVFLFPLQPDGGVRRLLVSAAACKRLTFGPRIGELLVDQYGADAALVAQAAELQQQMRQQTLGEVLTSNQIVSPEQLARALERQSKMPMVRIGEALIDLQLISQADLDHALLQQQRNREVPLGELLVRMGVVSAADLQLALAHKMGYPVVNVDAFPVEAEALQCLPLDAARRLGALPLAIVDGRLAVALDDPARRRQAIEQVEFLSQLKASPVLAHTASLDDAIVAAYQRADGLPMTPLAEVGPVPGLDEDGDSTTRLMQTLEREQVSEAQVSSERVIQQSDNSLVRLINNMIIEAHAQGASDIHIETQPGHAKTGIRFRRDGRLHNYLDLPSGYRNALVARLKIMCDLDISERRKPQDGKINFARFSPQHKIELRVATIPTHDGVEDVVMRILASARPMPMQSLGLHPQVLADLSRAVERPYGLVLCVGPTGSGKTTTLHSILGHVNRPDRKIWTAEDPIEITQAGLRQVQINPRIDWTFAKALRAFLRADPDIIMVGEMRDKATAQTAIEASLTGHLVLSTLHTNSAPETVTRLLDMGMDPFNFADSLLAVLAQRLVRRLCLHCRRTVPATAQVIDELLSEYRMTFASPPSPDAVLAHWRRELGQDGVLQMHIHTGCPACRGTGFKGRVGLHELMLSSREIRHLIQTGARADAVQQAAMAAGMRTLRQDGIEKVLAGHTTIDEVRATTNIS